MKRVRVRLRGIVQGVGFRPFVHNLAAKFALAGSVRNSSAGLVAEVEGEDGAVEHFVAAIRSEAPPLAWIQDMAVEELPVVGESGFEIHASAVESGEFALIAPDVATCAECLRDCREPGRRSGYPFTNCTNCGPRYTIIRDIPYDRASTTMAAFRMCVDCLREYGDPANRRFHAQPNACSVCGPSLSATLSDARARLEAGEIVAIKGLGGFHLACDPWNATAVERLRARKKRSDKPFALMARDLAVVERLCEVSEADRASLAGWRRPIVLMPRRPSSGLPEAIAPANRTLGVMLPYTPLHHLLFEGAAFDALVMTSGNMSEEPIVVDNEQARERIGGVADWFLTHNRDIYMRTDDSVVRTFEGRERVLRRSRGYAPQTLDLGRAVPEMLACGGELKNVFCLTKGRHAILSQHIGDLENYETLLFFEETLANLKKLFRVDPRVVAHDLHPAYLSTEYALKVAGVEHVGVQHHHAHIASCMAENGLDGQTIGVAFDGTGYGTDGTIWGGEFLVVGYRGFERRAHYRYIPLAGGDAAVRQPWRSALAYIMDALGPDAPFEAAPEGHVRVVRRMIATGVNSARTSSCGRLFDAVASLIGLRQEVNFEGQAAIELEAIAEDGCSERYPYGMDGTGPWAVDFRPTIEAIVRDVAAGVAQSRISAKFQNTVAESTVEVCGRIAAESGLRRVCLSGGTFQNVRLLAATVAGLRANGLEVFLHAQVPPNDGGIALGQAAIAAERTR
jgi:hydrogenase maturation protein HypF